jgi:hypothetical protein
MRVPERRRELRPLLALVVILATACPAAARDARAILDHVDDLFRGSSSHGRATMHVVAAHWERTLTLEFWTRGKERSLIRILAPKKERGTATLKVGNDLWNYLPKVRRVVKLPSSMMSASWMGSHLTNDDLVKESRMADDYDFTITFDGVRDGATVVDVTCTPKPDAPVVWGRVVVEVGADDLLPRVVRYFDEDLDLARTMTYSDVETRGGRRLPTRLRVVPADKPAESTTLTWDAIEFDVALPEDTFSLRTLQQ